MIRENALDFKYLKLINSCFMTQHSLKFGKCVPEKNEYLQLAGAILYMLIRSSLISVLHLSILTSFCCLLYQFLRKQCEISHLMIDFSNYFALCILRLCQ